MSEARPRFTAITVNGIEREVSVPPETLLVDYLRSELGLTGTNVGCETSSCGACTVIVDGLAVKSCTMLAVQAAGAQVTTIEGLVATGMHPLSAAFLTERGFQCGYCTSGMIMAAAALLERETNPSPTDIREALEGNLCRCTGYDTIVRSVSSAAARIRGDAEPDGDRPVPRSGGGYVSRGL